MTLYQNIVQSPGTSIVARVSKGEISSSLYQALLLRVNLPSLPVCNLSTLHVGH